jgi:hypothetical protein
LRGVLQKGLDRFVAQRPLEAEIALRGDGLVDVLGSGRSAEGFGEDGLEGQVGA